MSTKSGEAIFISIPADGSLADQIAAVKKHLKPDLDGAGATYYLSLKRGPVFRSGRMELVYLIVPAEMFYRPQSQTGLTAMSKRKAA